MSVDVITRVNGLDFRGWTDISVTRVLGELCADFSFSAIDFPKDDIKKVTIGSEIEILIKTDSREFKVLTGYINRTERSSSEQGYVFGFAGRDKTSDLVGCSAIYPNNTWARKSVSDIIADLCSPFSIGVDSIDIARNDPIIEKFSIKSGETVFDAIDRLCKAYGILPTTDINGDLVLTNIGILRAETQLIDGINLKTFSAIEDDSDRYSTYIAKGQARGIGGDWLRNTIDIRGEAIDNQVLRYRPMVFMVERHTTRTDIQRQVNWEAQIRAGRAEGFTCVLPGWQQDPKNPLSEPWAINSLVEIQSDTFGLSAEMIISSVNYASNEATGRVVNLELSPPEIFAADPGDVIQLSRRHSVRPN